MKKQCMVCRVKSCGLEEGQSIKDCPINKFLHILGGKRSMIVLLVLEKPHRFGELKRSIPDISEKMLITTLHSLENTQLIHAQRTLGKELKTTYSLTEKGQRAIILADGIAEF